MGRTTRWILVGIAVMALVVGLVWQPWTATAEPQQRDRFADDRPVPSSESSPMSRDQFGQDRAGTVAPGKAIPFDGKRSLQYLTELCDIGPRVSGTAGMAKQQKRLVDHFEKHGAKVTRQEFPARQRSQKDAVTMTNLIASWHPDRKQRIILCSHYDTRPAADQEPNRRDWHKPFVSANDGTSGVAFLMELAHHMADIPTGAGVDFVLFDGEEYIFDPGVPGIREGDKYFFGSEHFAQDYAKQRGQLPYRYEAAVLLDLFAHADARLAVEGYSFAFAPGLVTQIWKIAESVGAKSFRFERGFGRSLDVLDDHVALNRAGIPAVDIIDFDYEHWHRLSDTPEKCSPQQMAEVAKVITTWLQGWK
ncbi:MAG: M28 family peptidase [Bacteroidales bacterium]|nr:M28 family peptidase [Bacteroidales bacterium]